MQLSKSSSFLAIVISSSKTCIFSLILDAIALLALPALPLLIDGVLVVMAGTVEAEERDAALVLFVVCRADPLGRPDGYLNA